MSKQIEFLGAGKTCLTIFSNEEVAFLRACDKFNVKALARKEEFISPQIAQIVWTVEFEHCSALFHLGALTELYVRNARS